LSSQSILIRGARQNNLKGLDLELPLGEVIVVTGVSGSGKSSLAFDAIYAAGQRRYVETFSPALASFSTGWSSIKTTAAIASHCKHRLGHPVSQYVRSAGDHPFACIRHPAEYAHRWLIAQPANHFPYLPCNP
jgi:ABC-type ATPase with predicted acetyltransferase domain